MAKKIGNTQLTLERVQEFSKYLKDIIDKIGFKDTLLYNDKDKGKICNIYVTSTADLDKIERFQTTDCVLERKTNYTDLKNNGKTVRITKTGKKIGGKNGLGANKTHALEHVQTLAVLKTFRKSETLGQNIARIKDDKVREFFLLNTDLFQEYFKGLLALQRTNPPFKVSSKTRWFSQSDKNRFTTLLGNILKKENTKVSDWSPVDVWLYNTDLKYFENKLEEITSIEGLNQAVQKWYDENKLIPISLKKTDVKNVKFKKLNYKKEINYDIINYEFKSYKLDILKSLEKKDQKNLSFLHVLVKDKIFTNKETEIIIANRSKGSLLQKNQNTLTQKGANAHLGISMVKDFEKIKENTRAENLFFNSLESLRKVTEQKTFEHKMQKVLKFFGVPKKSFNLLMEQDEVTRLTKIQSLINYYSILKENKEDNINTLIMSAQRLTKTAGFFIKVY